MLHPADIVRRRQQQTVSDVVEHSELDLDVADIEAGADLLNEDGFKAAYIAYAVGGNRWERTSAGYYSSI